MFINFDRSDSTKKKDDMQPKEVKKHDFQDGFVLVANLYMKVTRIRNRTNGIINIVLSRNSIKTPDENFSKKSVFRRDFIAKITKIAVDTIIIRKTSIAIIRKL